MKTWSLHIVLSWLVLSSLTSIVSAQGIFLPASGAVNRGMGGATTGAAIDSIGSLYWNPATISGFQQDELAVGFELFTGNYSVDSTFPNVGSGSTNDDSGATAVPSVGWVHQTRNPNVKIGFGLFGAAGYNINMPANANNPITSPAFSQGGVGIGKQQIEAVFYQMTPVMSVAITDRLSLGLGPVINMGRISLDENTFTFPNANGLYPRGNSTRYHWGLGAQLGMYYIHDCCWQFGANVKTPMWFEEFRYYSEDAAGLPRYDEGSVTLPLITTIGTAYTGFQDAILTADFRYFNYAATEGFGDPAAFEADGRVSGSGWNDVFSFHLGTQVQLTSRVIGRLGYMYVTELIDQQNTFFNVGSDLSYRHVPTVGGSLQLNQNASLSFAYNYVPEWGGTGPFVAPGIGPVPGSSVTNRAEVHIGTLGINVRY